MWKRFLFPLLPGMPEASSGDPFRSAGVVELPGFPDERPHQYTASLTSASDIFASYNMGMKHSSAVVKNRESPAMALTDETLLPLYPTGSGNGIKTCSSRIKTVFKAQDWTSAINYRPAVPFLFAVSIVAVLLVSMYLHVAKDTIIGAMGAIVTTVLINSTMYSTDIIQTLDRATNFLRALIRTSIITATVAVRVFIAAMHTVNVAIKYAQPITTSLRIATFTAVHVQQLTMIVIFQCLVLGHFGETNIEAVRSRGGINYAPDKVTIYTTNLFALTREYATDVNGIDHCKTAMGEIINHKSNFNIHGTCVGIARVGTIKPPTTGHVANSANMHTYPIITVICDIMYTLLRGAFSHELNEGKHAEKGVIGPNVNYNSFGLSFEQRPSAPYCNSSEGWVDCNSFGPNVNTAYLKHQYSLVISCILSRGAFGIELSDEKSNPPGPDMAKPLGPEANPPGPDMAKPLGPEAIYTLGLLSAHSALASKQAPERMIAVNLTDVKPDPQGPDMAKPLGPEANPLGPDKATQQFINTERLTPASLTIDENPGELTSSRDEAIPPNSAKYDGNRPDEAIPIGNNLTHINILAITTPPHSRRYQDQRGAVLTCHDALSGGGVNDDIARGIPDIPTPTGIKHGGLDP